MNFIGQFAHRLRRDDPPLAARERSLTLIERGEEFLAPAFSLDPKVQRLFYRILLPADPTRFKGASDEFSLLEVQLDLHQSHPAISRLAASTAK